MSESSDSHLSVHARGLTKHFGQRVAVDGVDFEVRKGEAFGFLGPNGAGKTTTMRMISSVSAPDSGYLQVLGLDPVRQGAQIRACLGVVPQLDSLDQELTVLENLIIYARYFGIPWRVARARARELLEFVQLEQRSDDNVEPLSGGMKRRLVIARGLVNQPELLILDEPTTGLDPQARHLVWDRLHRLKQQGSTLILTTHYMEEAEQLCDRLVIMDQARIVAEGSPRQLIQQHSSREVVELRLRADQQLEFKTQLQNLSVPSEWLADRVLLYTEDGDQTASQIRQLGLSPDRLLVRRATLEDVFLRLSGHSLIE
ncbi:MAG: ABC transporter ATP-binding protein [Candidatus Dormibacteraceae bacterium]